MRILDKEGNSQEVVLSLADYGEALDKGISFREHINTKFAQATDSGRYGDPMDQLRQSAGLYLKEVRGKGIRPPSLKQILSDSDNGVQMGQGSLTRNDGSQALTVSGRLLFATTILDIMESALIDNYGSYAATFNSMIATTQTVDTPYIVQPTITSTGPRSDRSQPIAQLAMPTNMTSITVGQKSYRMPEFSISLEVSHQAQAAITLDLIGIILRQQAEGERVNLIDEALSKLVAGDTDWGLAALSAAELVTAYDSEIDQAGVISNKAWIKWLRKNRRKVNIDWVIGDLDALLAVENRTGRPVVTENAGTDGRLTSTPTFVNAQIPANVKFFDVATSMYGANQLVGIDSSNAIKKWVWSSASYEAIEEFALRRSTALRMDFSEAYTRIYDDAWQRLSLTLS